MYLHLQCKNYNSRSYHRCNGEFYNLLVVAYFPFFNIRELHSYFTRKIFFIINIEFNDHFESGEYFFNIFKMIFASPCQRGKAMNMYVNNLFSETKQEAKLYI